MDDIDTAIAYLSDLLTDRSRDGSTIDMVNLTRWVTRSARTLEQAVQASSITPTAFHSACAYLNRAIAVTWPDVSDTLPPVLQTIGARLKHTARDSGQYDFLTALKPLADAYRHIKNNKLVMRLPHAPRRAKPLPANDDPKTLVRLALTEVADQYSEAIVASLKNEYDRSVRMFLRKHALPADAVLHSDAVMDYVCAFRSMGLGTGSDLLQWIDLPAAERDVQIINQARQDAKFVYDQFIHKNIDKLDAILDAKGAEVFRNIELLAADLSMNGLEARFHITFNDNSHFVVSNSVIWSISVTGKQIYRYPLVFHSAFTTDGQRLKRPNEERMRTIFAGKPITTTRRRRSSM